MTNMNLRYYVVHLPEQTQDVIKIDASRFSQKKVPADKVPVESHAVLNEMQRGKQAANLMFSEASATAMKDSAYHATMVQQSVKSSTADDMKRYRERYYVPNNATLIFVGNFDPKGVLDGVDSQFGSMAAGTKPATYSRSPANG